VPSYPANLDLDFSIPALISCEAIFNADELTSVVPMASFNFESFDCPKNLVDAG
jgi:hypothetical protein